MEEKVKKQAFVGLVTSFYLACWQQLGKVANPITNKLERNLEQAKYSIDMLIMLREKTKGNLAKEEEDTLSQAIANLQMNYVDEMKKPAEKQEKQENKEKPDVKKE